MLGAELEVEGVLEPPQCVVLLAGNGHCRCRGLVPCSVCLDLVLERVVIDIVQAPARHRGLFESLSELHLGAVRIVVSDPAVNCLSPRQIQMLSLSLASLRSFFVL